MWNKIVTLWKKKTKKKDGEVTGNELISTLAKEDGSMAGAEGQKAKKRGKTVIDFRLKQECRVLKA